MAKTRSTRAFSLLESLCMLVTLFVFGWMCIGVARYTIKHKDDPSIQGIMAPPEPPKKAEATKLPESAPKDSKDAKPAAESSAPAGSAAKP